MNEVTSSIRQPLFVQSSTTTLSLFLMICASTCRLISMGGEIVSLRPFVLPKVGQDESVMRFVESRPFDSHMSCVADAILANKLYVPLVSLEDDDSIVSEASNITAIVVGRITDVQLLFVSAANSNVTAYVAWYVAKVSVVESRKGRFPSNEFSFIFNDFNMRSSFYNWPYLKGFFYEFSFEGNILVRNQVVSRYFPYSRESIKAWRRFRHDNTADSEWILEKWGRLAEGEIVNITLENKEYVVITSVHYYSSLGESIRNYNDITRTIISLKTRDVATEEK